MGRFPSGQRGQTVNLLVNAFEGSNPSLPIPFYKEKGLRFECQRCSVCCQHTPGFVFLTAEDILRLVKTSLLSILDFQKAFLRLIKVGNFYRVSLKEKENYDCIFWEKGECTVYNSRPLQCRSFPFWKTILQSEINWNEQSKTCPGIGKGKLFSFGEIEVIIDATQKHRLLEIYPDLPSDSEEKILNNLNTYLDIF